MFRQGREAAFDPLAAVELRAGNDGSAAIADETRRAINWSLRPRLCENSIRIMGAKIRPLRSRCIRFFARTEG